MMRQYLTPWLTLLFTVLSIASQPLPPPKTVQFRNDLLIKTILPPLNPPKANTQALTTNTASTVPFQELQLNLCNSGLAKCYKSGSSIPEATSLITTLSTPPSAAPPTMLTINEICSKDVVNNGPLHASLAKAWPAAYTFSVFMPATVAGSSGANGSAFRCKNGDEYGSAVVGVILGGGGGKDNEEEVPAVRAWGGVYMAQDGASREQRVFVCAATGVDATNAGDDAGYLGCTTHLASTDAAVALAQCRALMGDVVPYLRGQIAAAAAVAAAATTASSLMSIPVVVGGDLNLKHGGLLNKAEVQDCVPAGFTRKGDGDVQHVLFSSEWTFVETKKFALKNTDHVAWQVKLSSSS